MFNYKKYLKSYNLLKECFNNFKILILILIFGKILKAIIIDA